MDEDWGLNANAPPFTLFKDVSPEEEAEKNSYVDIIVYNRWTKAQRRTYQRLKTQMVAKQIQDAKLKSYDELSAALGSLTFVKANSDSESKELDELIGKLKNSLKIVKSD